MYWKNQVRCTLVARGYLGLFSFFFEKDCTTLLACFDTDENEPCKVCPLSAYRSPRWLLYYWTHMASVTDSDAMSWTTRCAMGVVFIDGMCYALLLFNGFRARYH